MKTKHRLNVLGNHTANRLGKVSALMGAVILAASATTLADRPDPSPGRLGGIYKVISSTDPLFRQRQTREYFLDFGRGIQVRTNSAAAWRFPCARIPMSKSGSWRGSIFRTGKKSCSATPMPKVQQRGRHGAWRMRGISNGVIFERGNYRSSSTTPIRWTIERAV